jgi:hypothetical protein
MLEFSSPEGTILLSADNPKGYQVPGFEKASVPQEKAVALPTMTRSDHASYKFPGV